MSDLSPHASDVPSHSEPWDAAYPHQLAIQFTGSGREYGRIWLWNCACLLLSLGLYYPWAVVRKKRYFYQHTLVGGRPLDFDVSPLHVLLWSAFWCVAMAVYVWFSKGPLLTFMFIIVLSAIGTPLLVRASQRRLARQVSWSGLRFDFQSSRSVAYFFLAPASLVMLPEPLVEHIFSVGIFSEGTLPDGLMDLGLALSFCYVTVSTAWVLWLIKQYLQGHYVLGPLKTQFMGGGLAYAGLVVQWVLVLCWLSLLRLVYAFTYNADYYRQIFTTDDTVELVVELLEDATQVGSTLIDFVLLYVVYKMLFAARFQNLNWNRTRSASIGFYSVLSTQKMALLIAKNTLLIVLSLGFYIPYAVISVARLRLESITVGLAQDPADWLPHP